MECVPSASVLEQEGYGVSNFLLREEDIRTAIERVPLVIWKTMAAMQAYAERGGLGLSKNHVS
jgi:hypothetical protein